MINQTYRQVYLQKRPSYTRRVEHYFDEIIDTRPTIETIVFPCSSDGETINFSIGLANFTHAEFVTGAIFKLL